MVISTPLTDIPPNLSYAGLGRRVAAYLIDLGVVFAVLAFVAISMRLFRAIGLWVPAAAVGDPTDMWAALGVFSKLLVVLAYVVSFGPTYFILFHASRWQATFGKRALRIYVTNDAGRPISMARATGRWFAMFFFTSFGLLISLITIPTSKRRQALHDMAANTLVLNGKIEDATLESWRAFLALGIPFLWLVVTFLITM